LASPAREVLADCQDDEQDDGNHDAENDELHLHVLPPHLPPNLHSLLLEVLCLHTNATTDVGGMSKTDWFEVRA
jgi:hypothetical protein